MDFTPLFALALIGCAIFALSRGLDVRLVLSAAALALAALGGDVRPVVRDFFATFSNEKFVVPICSAMGFAYVLRLTECERHLVLLLVKPLRYVSWLLVPGVVVVGFFINIPVISQTSTAICLAPVAIPLMRAAGYSLPTIGSCLLLGASIGGELLNPGAPELLSVLDKTGVSTVELAQRHLPPLVFAQLIIATLVFWILTERWERKTAAKDREPSPAEEESMVRINLMKAVVPVIPLAMLFASGLPEPYRLFSIPDEWLILPRDGKRELAYNSRLIGLAMLVGVGAAMAMSPFKARDCVKSFFDGAGYGFANIVSLIVIANCFGVAIREVGLAEHLGRFIASYPGMMRPLAAFVPLAFAAVSGSGMASTQSLFGFFYGPAVTLGLDPSDVGALVSVGAAAGRTLSPVAAVVLMCGNLTGASPLELVKRVGPPLVASLALVVSLVIAGWL
jgi:DcuC family C4-dicarboxylate transporter